jgi:hypothetical protein
MNESTKRVVDWLTLPILGLPAAAVIWFGYVNNTHPSKIWILLLTLDTPFTVAALIWLGWRFLQTGEGTKRVVDWLTLIPLGFWPATAVWAHTHNEARPVIFIALLVINIPLSVASIVWFSLRMDKIKIVHWFAYNIFMFRGRKLLFAFGCLAIVLLIKRLWS